MSAIQIVSEAAAIEVRELPKDRCLVSIGEQTLVLSYDGVYELALKLAAHLSEADAADEFTGLNELLQ